MSDRSLVVRTPRSRGPERRWLLDLVLHERLGFDIAIEVSDDQRTTIRRPDIGSGEVVIPDRLLSLPDQAWLTVASLPEIPTLEIVRLGPPWSTAAERMPGVGQGLETPLPVLYGADAAGTEDAWRRTDTGIELSGDILGAVFFLLSRLEEAIPTERDRHARFPAAASAVARLNALRRPLADEYVQLLAAALRAVWPDLDAPSPVLLVAPTHDVDHAWAGFGLPLRMLPITLAKDLVNVGPGMVLARLMALLFAWSGRPTADPFDTYDFLMDVSERHGLRSTFYFMAGDRGHRLDGIYRLDQPALLRVIRRIHDRGHELGLHASYGSYRSPDTIRQEREALTAALRLAGVDAPVSAVRQHYLRFAYPDTWRAHELAELTRDSTLGWAEDVGFRAGTAHPYRPFDLLERRPLNLVEDPLVAMDATLFSYLALSLAKAAVTVRDLVDACRPFGGEAVLLYHNSFPIGRRERDHYRRLIADLTGGGPP